MYIPVYTIVVVFRLASQVRRGADASGATMPDHPPEFLETWKQLPEETQAQKMVKKLSLDDQRKLIALEGEPAWRSCCPHVALLVPFSG